MTGMWMCINSMCTFIVWYALVHVTCEVDVDFKVVGWLAHAAVEKSTQHTSTHTKAVEEKTSVEDWKFAMSASEIDFNCISFPLF